MQRSEVKGFFCGADEWAEEVAESLRSGNALTHHQQGKKCQSLVLCTADGTDQVVGFAEVVLGKPLGYPDFQGDKIKVLHIANIAVSAAHQKQGYLRLMIGDLALTGISLNLSALDLFVHQENLPAIEAYIKLDFGWHPNAPLYPSDNPRYRRMIRLL